MSLFCPPFTSATSGNHDLYTYAISSLPRCAYVPGLTLRSDRIAWTVSVCATPAHAYGNRTPDAFKGWHFYGLHSNPYFKKKCELTMNGDQITPPGLGRQAPGYVPSSGTMGKNPAYSIRIRKTVT